MLTFLKRFTGNRKKSEDIAFTSAMVVDRSCVIVGDIHGRFDLLQKLLRKVDLESPHDLIFLGDYVDRGDHSAEVLRWLYELDKSERVTCLMGNHEKMLIEFLDNPIGTGSRWLKNGGLQTLASFGVGGVAEGAGPRALEEAASNLKAALSYEVEQWLRELPLLFRNGNLVCVHAAVDPALPLSLQKPSTYLWGHPEFFKTPRSDGYWVAHGHTVVEDAHAKNGRISIDTGAYYTGRLTAAVIDKNTPIRFLDTH
ncbi:MULTISPECIES: metallophosphoesterase family protein [Falsihalocynthiibacter]|uniref:metallophosphoesterase family protein n=1 Tax=Falsihalocynthiibacter TaxID=2854182 RepID=UPI0030010E6B